MTINKNNNRNNRKKIKWKYKISFITCLEILDLNVKIINSSPPIFCHSIQTQKKQNKLRKIHIQFVLCTLLPNQRKCASHKHQR